MREFNPEVGPSTIESFGATQIVTPVQKTLQIEPQNSSNKPIYSLKSSNYMSKKSTTTKSKQINRLTTQKDKSENALKVKGYFSSMSLPRKRKLKPPVPRVNRAARQSSLNQTCKSFKKLESAFKAQFNKTIKDDTLDKCRTRLFNMTMDKINCEMWNKTVVSHKRSQSRKSSNSHSSFKLNKSFGSNNRAMNLQIGTSLGSKHVSDSKPNQSKPSLITHSVAHFDIMRKTPSPTPAVNRLIPVTSPSLGSKISDLEQPAAVVAAEMSLLGLTGKIDPISEAVDNDQDRMDSDEDIEDFALI